VPFTFFTFNANNQQCGTDKNDFHIQYCYTKVVQYLAIPSDKTDKGLTSVLFCIYLPYTQLPHEWYPCSLCYPLHTIPVQLITIRFLASINLGGQRHPNAIEIVVEIITKNTHTVVSCPKPCCHTDSLYGSFGYAFSGLLSPCLYSCTFHSLIYTYINILQNHTQSASNLCKIQYQCYNVSADMGFNWLQISYALNMCDAVAHSNIQTSSCLILILEGEYNGVS